MSGASLDIQLTLGNADEVKAAFLKLQGTLQDLTPVFRDIGEAMLNVTRERFNTQTAPDGTPWKPLSPAYKLIKKPNADKILTLYGRLRGTLTYQAGPKEVRIGTPLIYGATHQFGAAKGSFGTVAAQINEYTRRGKSGRDAQGRSTAAKPISVRAHTRKMAIPWGDIPARPFLGLSTSDEQELLDILNDHLSRAMVA